MRSIWEETAESTLCWSTCIVMPQHRVAFYLFSWTCNENIHTLPQLKCYFCHIYPYFHRQTDVKTQLLCHLNTIIPPNNSHLKWNKRPTSEKQAESRVLRQGRHQCGELGVLWNRVGLDRGSQRVKMSTARKRDRSSRMSYCILL